MLKIAFWITALAALFYPAMALLIVVFIIGSLS